MKRKLILTFTLFVFAFSGLYAQCNNPNGFDYPAAPGLTSCDAVSFCNGEINGYCGQLGATNVTWPFQLCDGNGVPNNMEWLAFAAAYTSITLTITPFNCPGAGSFSGIQAGLYTACEDEAGVPVPGACQTACQSTAFTLTANNLIIGNVYYLFIDGCAGDMCSYTITTNPADATALPPLGVLNGPITGYTDVCPGATGITYTIPEIPTVVGYDWIMPPGWTFTTVAPGNTIVIDFPSTASSGQLCVEAYNDCHVSNQVCIDINLTPPLPGVEDGEYCQGETYFYLQDGQNYTDGTYMITLFGENWLGCDSTVNLVVTENPPTELYETVTLCQGQSHEVCFIPYDVPGPYQIECGPNFNGCDSTINLDLVILDPTVEIQPPGIIGCGINSSIYLDAFGSLGTSYNWETADGVICDSPTNLFLEVCLGGTYCLTSTWEENGTACTAYGCIEVLENTDEPMYILEVNGVGCPGETNGSATIIINNPAIGPFAYDWDPLVSVSNTASGLVAGNYTVTITAEANGCTTVENITIDTPPIITVGVTQMNIACNGDETGTATATPSGGSGGFQYLWCNAQTSATATGLPIGPCEVIVTDANSCTATATVTITEAAQMAVTIIPTNVACNGGNSGSAVAATTGGTAPFTYLWSNTNVGDTATGLTAGNWMVTSTDSEGCTAVQTVTISEPTMITATTTQMDLACAANANGTTTVNPSGGVGNFTYSWCNTQTTATATGLPAGDCEVIVTDANNCSITITVTILAPPPLDATATATDVQCFGENDGTATVTVTGGTGSPSFSWCNSQGTATATGLGVGPCSVTVTDANGCTAVASVDLSGPASALSISGTSVDAECGDANGSISITVLGGTMGYSYLWNNNNNTDNPTGLTPGGYTVTVTDANECTAIFSINVETPTGLEATATATPASCIGGMDGTVTITIVGGTGPFGYVWDTPSIADGETMPTGLAADDYNVTVSDVSGCTFVTSATVEEPDEITISGNATDETCGESNGTISTNVQGGTPGYTYTWTPGTATGPNPTDLMAGNYSLLVTDGNQCTAVFDITVSTPNILEVGATFVNASCTGSSTGSINTTVTGGVGDYTYAWDGGLGDEINPEDVAAGTYTLTVTDESDCSVTTTVEIMEPEELTATLVSTEATCGTANGTATVTPMGGTGDYSYEWSGGNNSTTETATALTVDTYTVTITDENDCEIIETIEVMEPEAIVLSIDGTNASCFEGADGTITLDVTGGTNPFTYTWTGAGPVQNPNNLISGVYTVTVTDFNDCTETISFTIEEPDVMVVDAAAVDATCGDDNGSITSFTVGGTAPYTYAWSGGADPVFNPGSLAPGTYLVIVTDFNGCTATLSVPVETPTGLSLMTTVIDEPCNGDALGAIDLEVMGGIAPFEYLWDYNNQDIEDLNNLPAGTYAVTVTDATGCEIITSVTIVQPEPIALSETIIEATCGDANGSISLTVVGGTAPYSYVWTGNIVDQNPTDLSAGIYDVEVTDFNGCTAILTTEITTPPLLEATATQVDVSCNGGEDGLVDITVSGGTAPFTYEWTALNGTTTDEDPSTLPAGEVTGVVTDFNGCQISVTMTLQEPDGMTFGFTAEDASCGEPNGSIDFTVTGGTGPYTFDWDGNAADIEDPIDIVAGNYNVIVTDFNGCTAISSAFVSTPNALILSAVVTDADCNTTATGAIDLTVSGGEAPFTYDWSIWNGEDLLDYAAGSYTVTVTDNTDCSVVLTEVIGEPSAILITGTSTDALCGQSNGTISIDVAGGTAPYTFDWGVSTDEDPNDLPIGNYTVVVTDFNLCTAEYDISVNTPNGLSLQESSTDASCFGGADGTATVTPSGGTPPFEYLWSTLETSSTIGALSEGSVTVTVTDGDGCEIVSSSIIGQPEEIVIVGNSTPETCDNQNGTVTITVNGGTAPFTYLWSDASTNQNAGQLTDGDIIVTVTDFNGCEMIEQFNVSEPPALTGTLLPGNASCNSFADGIIVPTISGGLAPYEYAWSSGSTQESPIDFAAGMYTLTVTDANDCTLVLQETVGEPLVISITGSATEAFCGDANGSILIDVAGGTSPYTFEWSNMTSTEDQPGVAAGSYIVTVTDANGCTDIYNNTVTTPTMLSADIDGFDAACFGESSGTATAIPSGGTAPFIYSWSNGTSDINLMNVAAGNYGLSVTDATNCTVTAVVAIGEPTEIEITGTSMDALCGENNGGIEIQVNGGTTPYTFEWSNASSDEDPINLGPGIYVVTVTDGNGCTMTAQREVISPGEPDRQVVPSAVSCNGESDGSVLLNVSAGFPPFTYLWSNGETTQSVSGLLASNYEVTVTDANGCTYVESALVTQPDPLLVGELNPTQISCSSGNDGSVGTLVTGGTMPYNYLWNNGNTMSELANVIAGTYTVTVTDFNGCTAEMTQLLEEPDQMSLSSTADPTLCNDSANGSINLTVTGGTLPYAYQWSNGSSDQSPSDLLGGTYTVTVTDNNNCTEVLSQLVESPTGVALNLTSSSSYSGFNVSCSNSLDGSATVLATGGVGDYSYVWDNGIQTANADDLAAGTYSVTATDANGCAGETIVTLDGPEPLLAATFEESVTCYGDTDGVILVNETSGGSEPFMYSLDGSDFNQHGLFANLAPGSYELLVQDANGCEAIFEQNIFEPAELAVNIIGDVELKLGDSTEIEAQLSVLDTSQLQQYGWTQGAFWSPWADNGVRCDTCLERTIIPFATTKYEYLIVDEDGCIGRDVLEVNVDKNRHVYIPNAFSPNGDGSNDVFFINASSSVLNIQFFKVYNRWGEVVFELNGFFANDPNNGWNGQFKGEMLNPGVFVYHATIIYLDGHIEFKKGDVTIMR
jgi:gliding motility-associated-like protein